MTKHLKRIIVLTCAGSLNFLWGEMSPPPFEMESGMVKYDIRVDAQLTPDTNLSVKGSELLRFKDWGEVKIEEVNVEILTQGAIKYKESIKKFQKETKDTFITADFENEQLLERKKSSIAKDIKSIETHNLVKTGTETIAGLSCDIWETTGIKKCIYKGIILKLESHIYNISYVKVATEAVFDINTSENCAVPEYPVQEFGLFTNNIQATNTARSEDFCTVIKDVVSEVSENNETSTTSAFDDPNRIKFINHLSQDIFEKQKELLPQLLNSMKKMRECLQTVENPFEANQCIEDFISMKSKLGNEENEYIILWDNKRKNTLLDKIEDELIDLESRISCVNRAQNMNDLSTCMK